MGIDQFTHVHALPDENAAVAVLFNLTSEPQVREVELSPSKLGLRSIDAVKGAERVGSGEETVTIRAEIPAMSPLLIEINPIT